MPYKFSNFSENFTIRPVTYRKDFMAAKSVKSGKQFGSLEGWFLLGAEL